MRETAHSVSSLVPILLWNIHPIRYEPTYYHTGRVNASCLPFPFHVLYVALDSLEVYWMEE